MNKKTFSVLVVLIIALMSAGCVAHRHRSQSESPQPTPTAAYPAECQGQEPARENMWHGNQLVVKCYCVNGNVAFAWWKSVKPGDDPATYCHLLLGQRPTPEPAEMVATSGYIDQTTITSSTQTTATAQTALPPLPTVVPFPVGTAQPTATAIPVPTVSTPLPTTSAPTAKSELKKFAMYARDVKYECGDGAAKRSYHLVVSESQNGRVEQSVTQECHGQAVVCLTNEADKLDYTKPPCVCPSGQPPAKINQQFNIWTCK